VLPDPATDVRSGWTSKGREYEVRAAVGGVVTTEAGVGRGAGLSSAHM
jgi:hypothetical protein